MSNFMSIRSYKVPIQFLLQLNDVKKQINLRVLFL